MTRQLKYVELCTGTSHKGPAWIAHVETSRSGRMVYFNGRALAAARDGAASHRDIESNEAYWVSGVKRRGSNRHWAGGGRIWVESTAVDDLLKILGADELDPTQFDVIEPLPKTDKERVRLRQNRTLGEIYAELGWDDDAA